MHLVVMKGDQYVCNPRYKDMNYTVKPKFTYSSNVNDCMQYLRLITV